MDQSQEHGREQAPMRVPGVVVRLRVVTVQLAHAAASQVFSQQSEAVASGKAHVRQAALVGAARSVAQDQWQYVDTQMIALRSPDRAANQEAAVSATDIDYED